MQDLEVKFQGSPDKFGKASYCDLMYTESKLYDHVLYKDLLNLKDVLNYKTQAITLEAISQHIEDKYLYGLMEKNTIIQTQQQQIIFLRQKNRSLTSRNIERVKKIVKNHNEIINAVLKQKQEQVLVIQSQKQLLEKRINQLQTQLAKNTHIINDVERQREQMFRKDKQRQEDKQKIQAKLRQMEIRISEMEKTHKIQISKLHDQKLQMQLSLKKIMIQNNQGHKQQIQDLERFYEGEIQNQKKLKLEESLMSKESLNNVIKNYEFRLQQNKHKMFELQEIVSKLTRQTQIQKQKNCLLEADVRKQDEVLDKYERYLKESDENIFKLKQLLLQSQEQLEKAKVSLEKNSIEKDSFANRIKICQQQARMWRESYYLNKSRTFNDV